MSNGTTKLVWGLCFLLISNNLYAGDPDNVALDKGQTAPYAGVLLPLPRAQRIEVMSLSLDSCTKISSLKDQEQQVLTDRLNNAQKEETQLASQVDDHSLLGKVGLFVLGFGTASLLAYGFSRTFR